jgi:acyl-CoA thioester hydrolase
MDVVSHTNYIRWLEEARIDFMAKAGVAYDQIEAEGIMLPVLEVNCRYRHSLTYGDHFAICTRIDAYNGFKLQLSYEIFNQKSGVLCATATTSHCFTDSAMKPIRLPKKEPALHERFLHIQEAVCSFVK